MRPNLQFPLNLFSLLKKSLMESSLFCAVNICRTMDYSKIPGILLYYSPWPNFVLFQITRNKEQKNFSLNLDYIVKKKVKNMVKFIYSFRDLLWFLLITKVTVIDQRFKYQKENSVHMQQLVRCRGRRWKCNS